MSKFKVGDELEVVDGYTPMGVSNGDRIIVTGTINNGVYFRGDGGNWWHDSRFKLIKPKPDAPQPQPDSIMSAFNAVHDAIAPLSSLDRRKVIHAVKVLLDIP